MLPFRAQGARRRGSRVAERIFLMALQPRHGINPLLLNRVVHNHVFLSKNLSAKIKAICQDNKYPCINVHKSRQKNPYFLKFFVILQKELIFKKNKRVSSNATMSKKVFRHKRVIFLGAHHFLILMIIAALIGGCREEAVDSRLTEAGSLMETRPDSARAILESFKSHELKTKRDSAIHISLLVEALDKCHKDISKDTMLKKAAAYFDMYKDRYPLYNIKSHYYLGRVYYQGAVYDQALKLFMDAAMLAGEKKEYFWEGMAYRGMADTYGKTLNSPEELKYARREYEMIKRSGKQPYLNYAIYDLANAECNARNYDRSIVLLKAALDSACRYGDANLEQMSNRNLAINHLNKKEYREGIKILEKIRREGYSTAEDSSYLAYAYSIIGEIPRAEEMLRNLTPSDSLPYLIARYNIASSKRDRNGLIPALEGLNSYCENKLHSNIDQGLIVSISDYYQLQNEKAKEERAAARIQLLWFISIAVMVCMLIVLMVVYLVKRQKIKVEKNLAAIEDMRQLLKEGEFRNKKASEAIRFMIGDKYGQLSEIYDVYAQYSENDRMAAKVAEKVESLARKFAVDREKFTQMSRQVDVAYENLYTSFQSDFPNLKEMDYRLFIFSVHGFSNSVMALFLGEKNVSAVYERKRRIKDKIRKSEVENKEKYLRIFDHKSNGKDDSINKSGKKPEGMQK